MTALKHRTGMMGLRLAAIALFLLPSLMASAQGRWGVGLEWGVSMNPAYYQADRFYASAGYLIDDSGLGLNRHVNGHASLSLEWDWIRDNTLGLSVGIRGVGYGHGSVVLPVMLRETYYFNRNDRERIPFLFLESGALYNMDVSFHTGTLAGAGLGFRRRLGARYRLDCGLRISGIYYRPDVFDPDTDERVLSTRVLRNHRMDLNLEFLLAIRFR